MNALNLNIINMQAPYKVWSDNTGDILFVTEFGIKYEIEFDADTHIKFTAYWLNLINRSGKKSPNDHKLHQTIVCIIEEFFRTNPDILLYVCDTAGQQQSMRARLFLRWFNSYAQKGKYAIRTAVIANEEITEYVALIVPLSHASVSEILYLFDTEIRMFQEQK